MEFPKGGFVTEVSQIRTLARQINKDVCTAYKQANLAKADWQGDQYDEMVKIFQTYKSKIDSMLELVVTNIPTSLETISNIGIATYQSKYGSQVSPDTAAVETPTALETLTESGRGGSWLSGDYADLSIVRPYITEVNTSIESAKKALKDINGKVQGLTSWTGPDATKYKEQLSTLAGDLDKNFTTMNENFETLATEAVNKLKAQQDAGSKIAGGGSAGASNI
ncbi:MAG: hypothetical protein IJH20_02415 [Bacilli bacterium]|nr:hypothetical protein [Bacilli bacterium]